MRRSSTGLGLALSIVFGAVQGAWAQTSPFYQGKTLTLLVNFTAGGPADIEGRLMTRYLGKHLPGNPTIIVRNMGGAGGAIAANYLGQVAAPDGLTLSYFSGLATSAALGVESIKVNVAKFEYVAAIPGISVAYARSDLGGGITKPEDLLQKKDFWVGGLSLDSNKDMRIRLELDLLGLRYKYITGYPGTNEVRLAMLRNELQLNVESMAAYRASVEPLVKTGEAVPLWYDTRDETSGQIPPEAEGIPALPFGIFYKKIKGAAPENIKWEAFNLLNQLGSNFERMLVMPQNSPKPAVDALRKALSELNDDKEFRQEALTAIKFVPHYATDSETEKLFHDGLNPDPKLRAFLLQYIEEGRALNGAH